jgi:flagellar protein FliL
VTSTVAQDVTGTPPAPGRPGRKKKLLLLIGVPLLLLGAGGTAAWKLGLIPGLHGDAGAPAVAQAAPPPVLLDLPEIVTNLNATTRRSTFVKLRAKLEVARPQDVSVVQAAMPRLMDLFQTYLRETRPEELRGSVGTHRLREELVARANVAAAPARITDVLFVELLVQ